MIMRLDESIDELTDDLIIKILRNHRTSDELMVGGVVYKRLKGICSKHWISDQGDVYSTIRSGCKRKWQKRGPTRWHMNIALTTYYHSTLMRAYFETGEWIDEFGSC